MDVLQSLQLDDAPLTVLHLGCGRKGRDLPLRPEYADRPISVLSVDQDARLHPDIVAVLGVDPLPLPDESVDYAVAIHVLEHIGMQGETTEWFAFFEDLYRVLKPGGVLQFECPLWSSVWCWGDPTHTRAISEQAFVFFNQDAYRRAGSAISPYRIQCDFVLSDTERVPDPHPDLARQERWSHLRGLLTARKPFRPWWADGGAL